MFNLYFLERMENIICVLESIIRGNVSDTYKVQDMINNSSIEYNLGNAIWEYMQDIHNHRDNPKYAKQQVRNLLDSIYREDY